MLDQIFQTTATLSDNGKSYEHFGILANLCSLYGNKESDIVNISFKIAEDQSIPPREKNTELVADYWGWYDYVDLRFTMIYAKRFLLNMCFPYGIEGGESKEQGKAYRITLI